MHRADPRGCAPLLGSTLDTREALNELDAASAKEQREDEQCRRHHAQQDH
jgi:hypothetical protein